jgi:hypothetical protein
MTFIVRVLRICGVLVTIVAAGGAPFGFAADLAYKILDPGAYQSFVMNWTPADAPLCVTMQSQADWERVFHPAPIMGGYRPFSPPAEFWRTAGVLMVARVVNGGDTAHVFQVTGVRRDADSIDVDFGFHPPPEASFQVKWWLGVAVEKPLAPTVRFKEDGHLLCTVDRDAGTGH